MQARQQQPLAPINLGTCSTQAQSSIGTSGLTVVLSGGHGDGVCKGGFEGVVDGVHVGQPLDVALLPEAPLVERRQRPRSPRLRHLQRPLPLHARHDKCLSCICQHGVWVLWQTCLLWFLILCTP